MIERKCIRFDSKFVKQDDIYYKAEKNHRKERLLHYCHQKKINGKKIENSCMR